MPRAEPDRLTASPFSLPALEPVPTSPTPSTATGGPDAAGGPLEDVRFRAERPADRQEQIVVRAESGGLTVTTRPNRAFDETAKSFFERDWPDWLTGRIFDLDSDAR